MNNSYFQGSLFDDCSKKCEAYASCGGLRHTAPCGCIWNSPELRYQCQKCNIICRERGLYNTNGKDPIRKFADEIGDGYSLDQVHLIQNKFNFPASIFTYTDKQGRDKLPFKWIAADVKMLFNCRRNSGASLKKQFYSEEAVRSYLKVDKDCGLIAVFNGQDWMLESIWAMHRSDILKHLREIGFTICTAPTFSVSSFTPDTRPVPFSHNTAMLMRHHRMLAEIAASGMCAVPNLYWIDGDGKEIQRWSSWLKKNKNIYLISKDFTSTRNWPLIEAKLNELILLLKQTDRYFHILIIGTGAANAKQVIKKLTDARHTVSIITSAPVMQALHGSKYVISEKGKIIQVACSKSELPMEMLIKRNLILFETSLLEQ